MKSGLNPGHSRLVFRKTLESLNQCPEAKTKENIKKNRSSILIKVDLAWQSPHLSAMGKRYGSHNCLQNSIEPLTRLINPSH